MNRPILRASFLALAALLAVAFFFRNQLCNGFTVLFGDRNDGVIEIAILEHWYDVVRGTAAWNVTGYFYPHADTLGYNDGYLIYGLIYSFFRALGTDPFLGAALVNVVVKAVGFFAFHWFARLAIVRGYWPSLLGAALFVIANNSFEQALHAQLLSVSFAPLMAGLLWQAGHALVHGRRGRGLTFGLAAALFYGAWMLTSFYMAWFFGFFLLLFAAVAAIDGRTRRVALGTFGREGWAVGLIGAGFAVCLVPFLLVYLPVGMANPMHSFSEVMLYAPSVLDIVNVGTGHWLYGGLDRIYNLGLRPGFPLYSERTVGFPPLLLLVFAIGLCGAFRRRREPASALIAAGAGATVLSGLLVLHFGSFTAWYLVYAALPGAKAVRALSRYFIFLDFPVILIAMWGLDRRGAGLPRLAMVAIGLMLLAEQVNLSPPIVLDRAAEMRILASLPPPPKDCRAFYAATEQPPPYMGPVIDGLYSGNVAAMLVAAYVHLPTINGFSSINPADWNFAYPGRSDYPARVRAYAARHHLHALCGLDFRTDRWLKPLVP